MSAASRMSQLGESRDVKHPAPYSAGLYEICRAALVGYERVLDPFAGTGGIHKLAEGHETYGVEIEPEWAAMHPRTIVGDALALPFADGEFDAITTSPSYGNRMADHHNAQDGSYRRTYTHVLGRPLHEHNSGAMQWGPAYREFHVEAWREAARVLRPGGRLVLNIKDHVRNGERQHVAGWHVTTLCRLGFVLKRPEEVETPGFRNGANREMRYPEQVYVFTKAAW